MTSDEQRDKKTAVLVIRGWFNPVRRCCLRIPGGTIPDSFLELLRETLPGADLMYPSLPLGAFSVARPDDLVNDLLATVDRRFAERPFDRLIIVAFSAGTLLARNLLATARGASGEPDGELDPARARVWADRVGRMVLVAGITRGWSISSATPAKVRFLAPAILSLLSVGSWLLHRRRPFISQVKYGAPFVVESRLKLLQVERHASTPGAAPLPHTVLLLGSKDEYVSPADATDLGPRADFSYIEVPESNHVALLHTEHAEREDDPDRAARARKRAELLRRALLDTPTDLADIAMRADDIDDWQDDMDRRLIPSASLPDPSVDRVPGSDAAQRPGSSGASLRAPSVDRVVFIIHGIRDNGFWTKRIAREVKALGHKRTLVISAPSPSYGFFSLWDFVNPWGRLDATHWFLEKYAEIKVRWPGVPVSFIGHSNGTFLAAQALADCRMVAFDRIVFAGSVVRTDYPWHRTGGRVQSVLNLVATADWVVACLPGAFERLGLRFLGVGGAGFDGFSATGSGTNGPRVDNFRFVAGGHGAGIAEPFWRDLARYVVDGTAPEQPEPDPGRPRERSSMEGVLARLAWLGPLVILAGLAGALYLMISVAEGPVLAVLAGGFVLLLNNIARYY